MLIGWFGNQWFMDFNSFYQIELYLVDTPRTEQISLRSYVRKVWGFLVHPAIGNGGIFTEPYWGGMPGERDNFDCYKKNFGLEILSFRFRHWVLGSGGDEGAGGEFQAPNSRNLNIT